MRKVLAFWVAVISLLALPCEAQEAKHGIALHGEPKYPPNFAALDYVNPYAPRTGEVVLADTGTFDTVNPFTLKGVAASGSGMVFETLMAQTLDEPFSEYGWIAESITVGPKKDWVSFRLRSEAVFQDGKPVTADDVIFSFEVLRDKGHPFYRSYYKDVVKVEKTGPSVVKFWLKDGSNAEMPLILGQLPVFRERTWRDRDFSATTLDPIIGSGPYKIEKITPGRSITYVRDPNWWARNLPINMGRYNFDRITYDYYRDSTVATEAFLAGRYDYRFENVAKNWAIAYKHPNVEKKYIRQQEIKNELPSGMQGFVMNTRRPMFADRRVRQALGYAFDFEWSNKTLAYGAYSRTASYFENSDMAARGPITEAETALLAPYRGKIPDEVFTREMTMPQTDGSGDNRDNLRIAADLLRQAGWTLVNGSLVDARGQPFIFEIIGQDAMFERWIQPYIRNLERLGIKAAFRVVDSSQYQRRLDDFDFDMTVSVFGQSLSPGNEQFDYWGSTKADVKGSRNLIGVKDPVVDALVEKLVRAESREQLVTICRALDRVLMWQYYVVPHWHIGKYRIAYWDKFGQPPSAPPYGLAFLDTWWVDTSRVKYINDKQDR